jgi:hypothetical protein
VYSRTLYLELPETQRNSGAWPASLGELLLTVLPKEGKDVKDIKNWRPIPMSNCNSKIITKALAIKMSKVLDDVIESIC